MFGGIRVEQQTDEILREMNKAIQTGDVSGLLLVTEDLSPTVALMVPKDTPLRNTIKRTGGFGSAHSFYQLRGTTNAEGVFIGTGPKEGFFPRGGLPKAKNPNYKKVAVPYVSLGDLTNVPLFDIKAGRNFQDIEMNQVQLKTKNTMLMEEWAILNGDSDDEEGLQFDGLMKQVVDVVSNGGDPFKLKPFYDACQQISFAGGQPTDAVMAYRDKTAFNKLIFTQFYGIRQNSEQAMNDLKSGFDVKAFDFGFGDVNMQRSRYILPGYGDLTNALVLDMVSQSEDGNSIEMKDMMAMSAIPLALLQTSFRTLIAEFLALIVTIPIFQRKITNIAASEIEV